LKSIARDSFVAATAVANICAFSWVVCILAPELLSQP
jgi:hypothetical protein